MAEVFSFSLFPFSFLGFLIDIEMEIEGAKFVTVSHLPNGGEVSPGEKNGEDEPRIREG